MENLNIPQPLTGDSPDQGNEMICRTGGVSCVPLDEWTSKLT